MKHLKKYLLFVLVFSLLPFSQVFASANDFYFSDYTADYYLSKLEDGTSKLHVKEVLTAVFPETDQNHGITRTIPFKNQDGRNKTIKNEEVMNLSVLRNGEKENISKIEQENDYYIIYIGSADTYVHGEQVYTLEYDFTDVITEFDKERNNVSGKTDVEKAFQEIYWDTNGTGWSQAFGKVTANIHLPADVLEKTKEQTNCYVGYYGESGAYKCTTIKTEDGYQFTTSNLSAGENLTFVIQFEAGAFEVINDDDYVLVTIAFIEFIVIGIILIFKFNKYNKNAKAKNELYRTTFTAPQYQPLKEINVAEAEQLYFKKTKSSYVATLLELAVSKKVSISKDESKKKDKWNVTIEVEPDTLTGPQIRMLKILKGGGSLEKGKSFLIEKHTATKSLAELAEEYEKFARVDLGNNNYLETVKNYTTMSIPKATAGTIISSSLAKLFIYAFVGFFIFMIFVDSFISNDVLIGGISLIILIIAGLVVGVFISTYLSTLTKQFSRVSNDGIKAVKYLEGLELYIKMAEEDRIKFLQSVKGADVTGKGIVRLYEKLLPWASLFGNEESWVKELAKYYEIEDVTDGLDPDMMNGIIASHMLRDVNNAVTSVDLANQHDGGIKLI